MAQATTTDDLIRQLKWRYATKRFDPAKKIPAATWSALEEALILAPSSFGLQPWRFLVIDDAAVRARLQPVSWNQPQIVEASHLVVFAIRKNLGLNEVDRYIARIAQVRGVSPASLDQYKGMMTGFVQRPAAEFDINAWSARQAYIALGVFLSAAALLGVDACPMEGFDPAQYDEILGLKNDGYSAVVIAAAGYRAAGDSYQQLAKVRFDKAELVKHI